MRSTICCGDVLSNLPDVVVWMVSVGLVAAVKRRHARAITPMSLCSFCTPQAAHTPGRLRELGWLTPAHEKVPDKSAGKLAGLVYLLMQATRGQAPQGSHKFE